MVAWSLPPWCACVPPNVWLSKCLIKVKKFLTNCGNGAAIAIVAGTLAAGAANAAPAAPSIGSLPTAKIQTVAHPGGVYRRCRGFGYRYRRTLPRGLIYRRLMRQGFTRIRNLYRTPGRLRYVGGSWRRMGGVYKATASRRFAGPFKRYRLRINACTGRVISARRIGFGWGGWGGWGGYGF